MNEWNGSRYRQSEKQMIDRNPSHVRHKIWWNLVHWAVEPKSGPTQNQPQAHLLLQAVPAKCQTLNVSVDGHRVPGGLHAGLCPNSYLFEAFSRPYWRSRLWSDAVSVCLSGCRLSSVCRPSVTWPLWLNGTSYEKMSEETNRVARPLPLVPIRTPYDHPFPQTRVCNVCNWALTGLGLGSTK